MPPSGGELYLETKIVTMDEAFCKTYQTKPGCYVKVSITDTGTGISEEGLVKGSATILLVDDEALIIDVAQAMLERLDYRVVVCMEGQEALKRSTRQ